MECTDFLKILGERIRTIRKTQGLSQERLAERSNLHPVFISNLENGLRRASICTYNSVAEALGVTLSELVEMPGTGEAWDSNMVALFQVAKKLDGDKQKLFIETVKGVLSGLGGTRRDEV